MVEHKVRVDLHTHSILSYDGGIRATEYKNILTTGMLDVVAITDHNQVAFALSLQQELGEQIIVGEEISTTDGHLIGLFLTKKIPSGKSALATAYAIKQQHGLVYVPHPLETRRSGITLPILHTMLELIDIVEVCNARSIGRKSDLSHLKLLASHIVFAAGSDAHGRRGVGTSYNCLLQQPNRGNLVQLLQHGERHEKHAPFLSLLDPTMNKLYKLWKNAPDHKQ